MVIRFLSLGIGLLTLCLLVPPAQAEKPAWAGGGNPANALGQSGRSGSPLVGGIEQTLVREYFHSNPVGAKPLPPGIAKQVARGKKLPPGIAHQQVPTGLSNRLPFCQGGLQCLILGNDLLITDIATGIVREILPGLVR